MGLKIEGDTKRIEALKEKSTPELGKKAGITGFGGNKVGEKSWRRGEAIGRCLDERQGTRKVGGVRAYTIANKTEIR